MRTAGRLLVVFAGAVALLPMLGACGVSVEPLEAFDVVITPTVDCTRNASSRDCVDEELLAQQRVTARWILEHNPGSTFSLTNEDGATLTGVTFSDDGQLTPNLDQIQAGHPRQGTGGLCYFARRRFESTDDDNNGCTRFGQLVVLILRTADDTFVARMGDIRGTDEQCGTSTVVERVDDVTGVLAAEPALAREEATEE